MRLIEAIGNLLPHSRTRCPPPALMTAPSDDHAIGHTQLSACRDSAPSDVRSRPVLPRRTPFSFLVVFCPCLCCFVARVLHLHSRRCHTHAPQSVPSRSGCFSCVISGPLGSLNHPPVLRHRRLVPDGVPWLLCGLGLSLRKLNTLHLRLLQRLPDGRPISFRGLVLAGACQSGTVSAGLC